MKFAPLRSAIRSCLTSVVACRPRRMLWSLAAGILGAALALPVAKSRADCTPQPIELKDLDAIRSEILRLRAAVPDQSHIMSDIGSRFSNLWFAAHRKNWALADYYLVEVREHLKWAIAPNPIHLVGGYPVDLRGISEAVDGTLLSEVDKAIQKKDLARFEVTWRQSAEGCYACHKAVKRPFLRPQVPKSLGQSMITVDPSAKWPN